MRFSILKSTVCKGSRSLSSNTATSVSCPLQSTAFSAFRLYREKTKKPCTTSLLALYIPLTLPNPSVIPNRKFYKFRREFLGESANLASVGHAADLFQRRIFPEFFLMYLQKYIFAQ